MVIRLEIDHYFRTCVNEVSVLMHGSCLHCSGHYLPKNFFNSPIMAARRFPYQNIARAGDYMVCLPVSTLEQKFAKVLIRHNLQTSANCYFGTPTPPPECGASAASRSTAWAST